VDPPSTGELRQVVHRASPAVRAEDLHVGQLQEVLGEVTSSHAGDAGDQYAQSIISFCLGSRRGCLQDPRCTAYDRSFASDLSQPAESASVEAIGAGAIDAHAVY